MIYFQFTFRSQLTKVKTPRTDGVFKVRQVVVLRAVPFRFLDLPPELRNMIYGYTFNGYGSNGPSKIDIHATSEKTELFGWYDTCFEGSKPTMRLGLLTTCRKIHKETASLFYGSQTFQIRTNQLYHFLSRLPLHIKYIRKVEISQPYSLSQPPMGKLKKGLRLLTGMEHLEHLQIDTWNLGARSTEWYALLLKEFLSTMQEKVNDREALCRKITFAKDYKGTLDDKLNFGDFLEAAFLYLKDKPELGVPEDTEPEGHLIPARRDTGRPRRSVVASKVISYAEDD